MKRLILIGLIPPAIVTAIAFLLVPFDGISSGGWVGVAVLVLVYLVQVTLPMAAPRSETSYIYSGTYGLVVYPYFVATTVIAVIGIVISAISWKWILAADLVVLGLAAAVILSVTSATERDAALQSSTKRQVQDLRLLAAGVLAAGSDAGDPNVVKKARDVAEQLRMSPFLGVPESADIEAALSGAVGGLRYGDSDALSRNLDHIAGLVKQRNDIVKFAR